jgi:hypothetical protein
MICQVPRAILNSSVKYWFCLTHEIQIIYTHLEDYMSGIIGLRSEVMNTNEQ